MRHAYRHGPSKGRRPTDTLVRHVTEHVPRAQLAGEYGWCQACKDRDMQATRVVHNWTDPDDGVTYREPVALCQRHLIEHLRRQ